MIAQKSPPTSRALTRCGFFVPHGPILERMFYNLGRFALILVLPILWPIYLAGVAVAEWWIARRGGEPWWWTPQTEWTPQTA